ncbi:MAG TPA: hypothetical protein PKC91_02020 [Ignavibacteria bacterium]|nr:hypothetical protein [Ignavibacteria bacterium]
MAAKISTPRSAVERCRTRQTGNFCFSHCSELFNVNFSQAGLFLNLNVLIHLRYISNDLMILKKLWTAMSLYRN